MTPDDVLAFWFAAAPGAPGYGRMREVWFKKDPTFDDEVRRVLARPHEAARAGASDGWASTGRGALALVILLDQVPRNIFRGEARAYACDGKARGVAEAAIARGYDRALLPAERLFLYLPFEHSEVPADQERALELFAALEAFLETGGVMKVVRRHAEIIRRFGRFPHRNAALGRATTPEEAEFLEEPESSF
ncbi:MAG: DUF924 family protein [Alphaproteobacteria bacterium]